MAASKFRLALVQLAVTADKALNIRRACEMIKKAVNGGAEMVILPECFNSPYGTKYFPKYAEAIPGASTEALAAVAKECGVYVVGGSIPERDGEKVFNTSTAFNRQGEMVAKYRKIHLFNIDIPGKITFKESETLTPGCQLAMFDTDWCKVGLGICYDMRFPELAALYANNGCRLICYPGAFNMTTGPAHWELLLQSRALDNQIYAAAISVARDETASYTAWGHSTVVDPWAKVLGKTDEKESTVFADIDLSVVDSVREQIPVRKQKREDLYELTSKM